MELELVLLRPPLEQPNRMQPRPKSRQQPAKSTAS
jgi:hypothetical protein